MNIKQFTKEIKGLKKEDLGYTIYDYHKDLVAEYIAKLKPKNANLFIPLWEVMSKPKFLKATKWMMKEYKGDIDMGIAILFGAMIDWYRKVENHDDEIIGEYAVLIKKILKPRVKEVSNKLDISPDLVQELLVIAPSSEYISSPKFVGVYSRKMIQKLYAFAGQNKTTLDALGITDSKSLRKLFQNIFGKELVGAIAVEILLERKEHLKTLNKTQQSLWNLLTEFSLEVIEKMDKDERKEALQSFCSRRFNDSKRDTDSARRISFLTISEEFYPKTTALAKKMSKNEEVAKWL